MLSLDLLILIPTTTLSDTFYSPPRFMAKKMRHREVKEGVLSPIACEWLSQGVNPGW